MFIAVLVNLHLVRGLMIGGVSDSRPSLLSLGFRTSEMLSSSSISVNLGVNSYICHCQSRPGTARPIQRSGLLLALFYLVNWLDPDYLYGGSGSTHRVSSLYTLPLHGTAAS